MVVTLDRTSNRPAVLPVGQESDGRSASSLDSDIRAPGDRSDAPRETAGTIVAGLLAWLDREVGEGVTTEVVARSGVQIPMEQLRDYTRWWSHQTRVQLYQAATDVLDDPDVMFRIGSAALDVGSGHSLVLVLRALGSPRHAFRQVPRAVAKFTTTSTMEISDLGPTSVTVAVRLAPGHEHSPLVCAFTRGMLTTVPVIFGLPPARIEETRCYPDADSGPDGPSRACLHRFSWERRSRLPRRRRDRHTADSELAALRGQLLALQSVAADLVASDDLSTVLARIVARAADAVVAPAYLLAVTDPVSGHPLVHSDGVPTEDLAGLSAALLAGDDLGADAVVVDVASARRRHGRLAALYPTGHGALGGERPMLAAYAGHAAAALDMMLTLEKSRMDADRAQALLALAHELAGASDEAAVCSVVAAALPRIVGCDSASVMLWHPDEGILRPQASFSTDETRRQFFLSTALRAEDAPEVLGMLSTPGSRVVTAREASPRLRDLLGRLGLSNVVAVPLLAAGTLLGVATASWRGDLARDELDGDVLARLSGVGDQAVTALQKARLVDTVRHQATHDALTGLPNRLLLLERLESGLRQAGPYAHLGVLFCDLDGFKEVNDTHGHASGDELLRQVGARLRMVVRPDDTVGRLSGDEFAIVLPGLADPASAHELAERVRECFSMPFGLGGTDVVVGTSVGVAVCDTGSTRTGDKLLQEADVAMYRDKQRGRRRREASPLIA